MDNLQEWLKLTFAAFAGTGSALLALRLLSGTIVGHWLAKGLVKYTAQVETIETRKRVAIERLDRQRSDAIADIMTGIGEFAMFIAYPPATNHDDPIEPEITFQSRYKEMIDLVQSVTARALRAAHLFEEKSPFIVACMEWANQANESAGSYWDALGACVTQEHWQLQVHDRQDRLRRAHAVMGSADFPAFKELVAVSRRMSSEPQD